MQMPGRTFMQTNSAYRYGFNGKENDNEVKGDGNEIDYGNRIYDPRVGRFLSLDPLQKKFPWYSPYQFTGNSPIAFVDLDGLERNYYIYEFSTAGRPVLKKMVTQTHEEGFWNGIGNAYLYAGILPSAIPYDRRAQYNGDLITDCSDVYVLHDGFLNVEFSSREDISQIKPGDVRALSSEATENNVAFLYYSHEAVQELTKSHNVEGSDNASNDEAESPNSNTKTKPEAGTDKQASSAHNTPGAAKSNSSTNKSPTYNRVKPRKATMAQIEQNQPRNAKGQMIDPHAKTPLVPEQTDLGHKTGQEWHRRKAMHIQKGSTRKQVLDAENDPSLYHFEHRSSNRSHKYEKKE
jgi:RHS repeat-associated protein